MAKRLDHRIAPEGGAVLQVCARELAPGDVTLGSRQRVLSVGGLSAPGKVTVLLERLTGRSAGKVRRAEWNRNTRMLIERPTTAAALAAMSDDERRAIVDEAIDDALEV